MCHEVSCFVMRRIPRRRPLRRAGAAVSGATCVMKCHDSRSRTAIPARLDRPVYISKKNHGEPVRSASSGGGNSGGADRPALENIAVFQSVASLARSPFRPEPGAVPARDPKPLCVQKGILSYNFRPRLLGPRLLRPRTGIAPPAAPGRSGGRVKGVGMS